MAIASLSQLDRLNNADSGRHRFSSPKINQHQLTVPQYTEPPKSYGAPFYVHRGTAKDAHSSGVLTYLQSRTALQQTAFLQRAVGRKLLENLSLFNGVMYVKLRKSCHSEWSYESYRFDRALMCHCHAAVLFQVRSMRDFLTRFPHQDGQDNHE